MDSRTLEVTGMSCGGCEEAVEDGLLNLDGVTRADADHEDDAVEVVADGDVSEADLADAVRDAGYEPA